MNFDTFNSPPLRYFRFLITITVYLFFASPLPAALHFPLPINTRLTGSFAENRGLHFHAGIDLSTGGREGIPVLAAAAGWVYRLRVSPYGYGKAVYLKLEDGRFAVYAHLRNFAPFLEEIIFQRQEEKQDYLINYYLPEGKIAIDRGQLIGYSGSSGTSVPHLHFELRDGAERPLNPLTHGLTIEDSSAPVIEGIAIRPLDGFSTADLKRQVFLFSPPPAGETDPVPVWGKIGLEVSAHDPSGENRLGIWRAELRVDDRLLFVNQYEEFSYDQYHQAPLVYDRELALCGLRDYQRLYRREGNLLPFHPPAGSRSGVLQTLRPDLPGYLSPGIHRVRIAVHDAGGGSDRVDFKLKAVKPSREEVPPWVKAEIGGEDSGALFLKFQENYIIVYVKAPGFSPDQIRLTFQAGPITEPEIALSPAGDDFYLGALELKPGFRGEAAVVLELTSSGGEKVLREEKILLQPVTPQSGGSVRSADGRAVAVFKGGEVYAPVFPRVSTETPPRLAGWRTAGPVYIFEPVSLSLNQKGCFSIRRPEEEERDNPSRIALYRLDGDDFTFAGNDLKTRPGWVSGFSRRLGKFALLEDTISPGIKFLFEPEAVFLSPRPELSARVKDTESGLTDSGLEMRLDNRKVMAEYIPSRDLLRYRPRQKPGAGKHILFLSARDRVGNSREEEIIFYIKSE